MNEVRRTFQNGNRECWMMGNPLFAEINVGLWGLNLVVSDDPEWWKQPREALLVVGVPQDGKIEIFQATEKAA